jgi:hypothetical protein
MDPTRDLVRSSAAMPQRCQPTYSVRKLDACQRRVCVFFRNRKETSLIGNLSEC